MVCRGQREQCAAAARGVKRFARQDTHMRLSSSVQALEDKLLQGDATVHFDQRGSWYWRGVLEKL